MNHGSTRLDGVFLRPIVEIHVHTHTPDAVFSYAAGWGRMARAGTDDRRVEEGE